jgi:multidrug efflux system membrane fusion protein
VLGGLALAAILGGYYFYSHGGDAKVAKARDASVPVRVGVVQQRDMAVVEHTIGTVVANSTVSVTARVQGQLISANFKEGQIVKTGDLLFRIDPSTYQAAYDSALATLASTKAKADRYARLIAQNAVSPQDADDAKAAYLQAKANAESAKLNLDFTRIVSPVNGKTGPILLQPGNLVSVNGLTAPLVTITQIQPIKVSFSLPQADLPRIQARAKKPGGLTATVNLHDAGGQDISAPVDFISNAVNAANGTIELRATFANTDASLVPGQLVDVVVELSDIPGAIVAPRDAVNTGPDGQYVFVVDAGRAEQVPVKVLFDNGTEVAVQGDVKDGDSVIIDGQLKVIAGGKVQIAKAAPGAAGAKSAKGKGKRGGRGGRGAAAPDGGAGGAQGGAKGGASASGG